jgi:hypothetical protein
MSRGRNQIKKSKKCRKEGPVTSETADFTGHPPRKIRHFFNFGCKCRHFMLINNRKSVEFFKLFTIVYWALDSQANQGIIVFQRPLALKKKSGFLRLPFTFDGMLKKTFLLALISMVLFCSCSTGNETTLVLDAMKAQEASWNAGNIPGFMDYYWKNDSLKFIGSKGNTFGWDKTLRNYQRHYPDLAAMGKLKFTILELSRLSPACVFVVGKWELEKEHPAGGHFSLLWRKISGKWVIVCDHTS